LPAEIQVGRSDGWLLNDRIRVIDLLRKNPANAGFFYWWSLLVVPGGKVERDGKRRLPAQSDDGSETFRENSRPVQ
jgi:hypothetical protein